MNTPTYHTIREETANNQELHSKLVQLIGFVRKKQLENVTPIISERNTVSHLAYKRFSKLREDLKELSGWDDTMDYLSTENKYSLSMSAIRN